MPSSRSQPSQPGRSMRSSCASSSSRADGLDALDLRSRLLARTVTRRHSPGPSLSPPRADATVRLLGVVPDGREELKPGRHRQLAHPCRQHTGLDDREIEATIKSAIHHAARLGPASRLGPTRTSEGLQLCRRTISRRPWKVVRALRWDTRASLWWCSLRQATPHPEALPTSTGHAYCHQRPGQVQLRRRLPAASRR